MRALLHHRDARLYLAGQSFSLLGDTALWLALALWAKTLTGSSSAAGLVIFCIVAPQLAAPLSGLLVDHVRRRRLLLVVNPLTAAAVLPLLAIHDAGDVWILYAVSLAYGVSYTLLGAGQSALLATMLPKDLLPNANAFLQTVREALRLVAPVAGVGLFTLAGGGAVALLDAGTFVVATLTLLALRFDEPRPAPSPERLRPALAAGARHIRRTPLLRRVVVACAIALAVIGFSEPLLFALPQGLHRPASFAGVLMIPQGIGAILGAVTATGVLARHGERAMAGLGLAISALGALMVADPSVAIVLAGKALYGFGMPWTLIALYTLLQRSTPDPLQGRVFATTDLLLGLPQTLSIAAGAALLAVVDYRFLLAAQAIGLGLAGGYLLVRRPIRSRP